MGRRPDRRKQLLKRLVGNLAGALHSEGLQDEEESVSSTDVVRLSGGPQGLCVVGETVC